MEKASRLTKNERLTLAFSLIAVTLSILSPVATYLWLQDSVREQQLRARSLQASGRHVLHINDPLTDEVAYRITLLNTGSLPLEGVTVSLRGEKAVLAEVSEKTIEWDPPWSVEGETQQGALLIHFKRALPPGQRIDLRFNVPSLGSKSSELNAWVSSNSSPSVPIAWAGGVVMKY